MSTTMRRTVIARFRASMEPASRAIPDIEMTLTDSQGRVHAADEVLALVLEDHSDGDVRVYVMTPELRDALVRVLQPVHIAKVVPAGHPNGDLPAR